MRYRFTVLVAALLLTAPVMAQTGIERIEAFLDEVSSLQAHFDQSLFDEEMNRLEDSSGEMALQRPGRFRWDYETPYPQSIISNGKTLWLYDSELAQVTVRNLDVAAENSPSMLLSTDQPLEKHFDVSELPGDDGKAWVQLVPKSGEATFAMIRIAFLESQLDSMELVDNFGQLTRIHFTDVTRNTDIGSDSFEFAAPPGVDVISEAQ